ncbi:hypothetical protein MMC10_008672 [Thelotrema lepadinum]|nr:hypothetical protein [Thelotrema lepadinum]
MSRVASLDEDPTIAAIHGPSKTKHPGSASSNFNISRSQAYNHLYGLSQVGTDDNKTPCPPTVYNMEGNGYIDVLNSLAFLLVSQPGEKAAATAYISPPILKLLWAKNANATPGDVDYVNKIVQDASRQACSVDITRAVLPVCKTQIRQHAMALLRAFGPIENETNLWGWERRRPSHRYIRDELIKSGIVVRGWSFIRCLDNFLHSIEEFKYQSDERLVSLLIFASALSHSDGIRDLVQSERLDLLRQLGRYHGSVENILSGARAFRSRGLKIQAELVSNLINS